MSPRTLARPKLAFVVSGEGTQRAGMARTLLESEPLFSSVVQRCDAELHRLADWSLIDTLIAPPERSLLGRTERSQPAIYAVEVGLFALLESWGVTADVVLGHSLGEAAGACAAGVLSLEEGFHVAFEQGRVLQAASGFGMMGAIGLAADELAQRLADRDDGVCIAALNAPAATVVSGETKAVRDLLDALSAENVFARPLGLDYAPHSPHVDDLRPELARSLSHLRPGPGHLPVYSTVAGRWHAGDLFDGAYWTDMVRQPVRFMLGVQACDRVGVDCFLEVAPSPALTPSVVQCLKALGSDADVLGTLRRRTEDREALLGALRALDELGYGVDWEAVRGPSAHATAAITAAAGGDTDAVKADTNAAAGSAPATLIARLHGAAATERREILEAHVAARLGAATGAEVASDLDRDAGVFDLGLDSLRAVELAEALARDVDQRVAVPATTAFDHPSIASIAAFLDDSLSVALTPDGAEPVPVPVPVPAAVARAGSAEPIAIVGMGCRFPGANHPDGYWQLLREGVDATTPLPLERFDPDQLFDEDPSVAGALYQQRGGFLDEVDQFDAQFFGISAREAESMDPQQRLLLEVAWEALEHSGLAPEQLRNTETGVYVGIGIDDYKALQTADPAAIDGYTGTGNLFCVAAGRVSYVLGLQGPSMAVDTGCSSSLVTVHLASQALRAGECDLALAGGVHLMLGPDITLFLSRARALSLDGRSKTFDAAADGYSRGEGCGMVVLKRLRDAQADGDDILAVLRGSAVNHDGPSSGLTVPNGGSQQKLIRRALRQAGTSPEEISYVEAHGTGTPLGDPIELRAMAAVLGENRPADDPLLVGSAKTNIGHLESAAGIAGLMKVVLAMRHGELPPHLHLNEPNPRIPWDELPVEVPRQRRDWRSDGAPLRAGVSSFGIGGTNAHVIVEEAPARSGTAAAQHDRAARLFVLSARDDAALRELATRYAGALTQTNPPALADVVHTASTGRSHFGRRLAVVARSSARLGSLLAAFGAGESGEAGDVLSGGRGAGRPPRIAFLFTGQGSQYVGMGRGLHDHFPRFRATLERCEELLAQELERPLRSVMFAQGDDGALLTQTRYTQPALFALEVALADLLASWGITPDVVLGHSVGELAAATIAGVIELDDALALVARRGALMQELPAGGRMVALFTDADTARRAIAPHSDRLSVAALNGPRETVVSGADEAVQAVVDALGADGVRHRELSVSHAFHSPLMEPALDALQDAAGAIALAPARVAFVSTVTGAMASAGDLTDPAYWRRNAREPVAFADAIGTLLSDDDSVDVVVELGPSPALSAIARRGESDDACTGRLWSSLLRKGTDDVEQALGALGALYVHGAQIAWPAVDPGGGHRIALPTYAFQTQRHWRDTRGEPKTQARRRRPQDRPLLVGERLRSPALRGAVFETRLDAQCARELAEHEIGGEPVVPASAHLAALVVAAIGAGMQEPMLHDIVFPAALVGTEPDRIVQVLLDEPGGAGGVRVVSADADGARWSTHAEGFVAPRGVLAGEPESATSPAALRERLPERSPREWHDELQASGYRIGDRFRWIGRLWSDGDEALAEIERPSGERDDHGGAPQAGLLDSCMRVGLALAGAPAQEEVRVPVSVGRVWWDVNRAGAAYCHALRRPRSGPGDDVLCDIAVLDGEGAVVGQILGLHLKLTTVQAVLQRRGGADGLGHVIRWEPAPAPAQGATGPWAVVADRRSLATAAALTAALSGQDQVCEIVPLADDVLELRAAIGALAGDAAFPRSVALLIDGTDDSPVPDRARRACAALLGLFQAQAAQRLADPPRLVVVTRGAQGAAGAPTDAGGAAVWGLARVIAAEHGEHAIRLVDLEPAGSGGQDDARWVRAAAAGDELALAVRRGVALQPRLVSHEPAEHEQAPVRLRADGTYLVTGGLGAVGLHLARWLTDHGARTLALVGRRPPSEDAERALDELRAAGVEVSAVQADVSDRDDLRRVLAEATGASSPLRGVVHAAGIADDGTVLRQDVERMNGVLGPKVAGAWHLHELTSGADLDCFVLCSSLSAVAGTPGQGPYAAANAALDAIAEVRHAQGLPAVSVGWGPWSGLGMAATLDMRARERLAARGIAELSLADAEHGFATALGASVPVLAVARIDAGRWAPNAVPCAVVAQPPDAGDQTAPGRCPRPAQLGACNPPRTESERIVADIWEQLFKTAPIGVDDDFYALGGDSILGLQIAAQMRKAGLSVDDGELLIRPTIAELLQGAGPAVDASSPAPEIETLPPEPAGDSRFPDSGLESASLERLIAQIGGST